MSPYLRKTVMEARAFSRVRLHLKSERLLREGREEGRQEGYASFRNLIRAGVLTIDQALDAVADKADFQRWMNLQK